MTIQIRISTPDDVYHIRDVQKRMWMCTYPNEKEGITVENIKEVFDADDTPEGREKLEERKKRYENTDVRTWVAQDGENIIGFCIAGKEKEKNRIHAIYVYSEYQGKGIGRQLMQKALSWLGTEKEIFVYVVRYNTKAIDFYTHIGFTRTGNSGVFDNVATLPCGKSLPEIELIYGDSQK